MILQGLNSLDALGDVGWGGSSAEQNPDTAAQLEQQRRDLAEARAELESAVNRAAELQQQVGVLMCNQQPLLACCFTTAVYSGATATEQTKMSTLGIVKQTGPVGGTPSDKLAQFASSVGQTLLCFQYSMFVFSLLTVQVDSLCIELSDKQDQLDALSAQMTEDAIRAEQAEAEIAKLQQQLDQQQHQLVVLQQQQQHCGRSAEVSSPRGRGLGPGGSSAAEEGMLCQFGACLLCACLCMTCINTVVAWGGCGLVWLSQYPPMHGSNLAIIVWCYSPLPKQA